MTKNGKEVDRVCLRVHTLFFIEMALKKKQSKTKKRNYLNSGLLQALCVSGSAALRQGIIFLYYAVFILTAEVEFNLDMLTSILDLAHLRQLFSPHVVFLQVICKSSPLKAFLPLKLMF